MSEPESDSEGETITLHELLERSARAALDLQREDGSFPPGRNGVYDEPETPVRTTSYWLTVLSKVYQITNKSEFFDAANGAADYLLSKKARPSGHTYFSRNVEGKDRCDGLVGQAAPIRAMARAAPVLDRTDLKKTAEEVFQLHPFDHSLGLWKKVEVNGKELSLDRTLNHQITFAAAASNILEMSEKNMYKIQVFLDMLNYNMGVHSNGIIQHYIRPRRSTLIRELPYESSYWKLFLNEIVYYFRKKSFEFRQKEVAYHPVNLRGISVLKQNFPNHCFWDSCVIKNIIDTDYIKDNNTNSYSRMLNATGGSSLPGHDIAFALLTLSNKDISQVKKYVKEDIDKKYDFDEDMMYCEGVDDNFQSASIYRMAYLPDIPLN